MSNRLTTFVAVAIALTLAACFIVPGKFASTIDVSRDGGFSFAYQGELMFATSPALIRRAQADGEAHFEPECYNEEDIDERPCTDAEIADQRAAWEVAEAKEAADLAQFAAMFGGINPADPATMDAFAVRLAKEQGWKSVVHKGDGVFAVDYALNGRLDRDFVWPIFPGVAIVKPIIVAHRRADGSVEISGPGLATADQQAARTMGQLAPGAPDDNANARTEGVFTLTTDGEVLTNNTQDGPATSGSRKTLRWTVTPYTTDAPRSLLKLD